VSEHLDEGPVTVSLELSAVIRIRAALQIAVESAEERAQEAAGGRVSTPVHISVLPLSKRRAVEGYLADRAECLALLAMLPSEEP
jgi:hypothetical protein